MYRKYMSLIRYWEPCWIAFKAKLSEEVLLESLLPGKRLAQTFQLYMDLCSAALIYLVRSVMILYLGLLRIFQVAMEKEEQFFITPVIALGTRTHHFYNETTTKPSPLLAPPPPPLPPPPPPPGIVMYVLTLC